MDVTLPPVPSAMEDATQQSEDIAIALPESTPATPQPD